MAFQASSRRVGCYRIIYVIMTILWYVREKCSLAYDVMFLPLQYTIRFLRISFFLFSVIRDKDIRAPNWSQGGSIDTALQGSDALDMLWDKLPLR